MKIVRPLECIVEPSNVGWLVEFSVESRDIVLRRPMVIFLRDREIGLAADLDGRYPKGFTDDYSN